MATSSFSVQNYASREWAVTFDIIHKDGTPLTTEETIKVQCYDAPPERHELLAVMDKCIREVFGDDHYYFTVYFMRTGLNTRNPPHYWHYFKGDTVMGGYIEFFFMDKILTIPGMMERMELLMQKVVGKAQTYAIKIVHVNVGTFHSPKCQGRGYHDLDEYRFTTKK